MLQCGAKYYEDLTPEKVDKMLEDLKAEGKRSSYVNVQ
jgi:hypothetical protein